MTSFSASAGNSARIGVLLVSFCGAGLALFACGSSSESNDVNPLSIDAGSEPSGKDASVATNDPASEDAASTSTDASTLSDASASSPDAGNVPDASTPPLALVYRGAASCDGCSEAVKALLETSKFGFQVMFVGPKESLQVDDATLAKATVYAQPGGDGSVSKGWKSVQSTAPAIRKFVQNGGHYLGFCMGGYFAGKDPGFEILPGDTDQWIASSKASVTTEDDALVDVVWRGKPRTVYFQDGPYFIVDSKSPDSSATTILATYKSNGKVAALVAPFGKGRVAVVGPHPEADDSWYKLAGLKDLDGLDADLGHDLVEAMMQ